MRKKPEDLRPQEYTQDIADSICELLAMGFSIRRVCEPSTMPSVKTFFRWLRTNEQFRKQYYDAKQEATDAMAEDIVDISDDSSNDIYVDERGNERTNWEVLGRSKLRVDTRKWLMAKMKPVKYGDKLDVTSDGKALPTPIYGGNSATFIQVSGHNRDTKNILPKSENQSS